MFDVRISLVYLSIHVLSSTVYALDDQQPLPYSLGDFHRQVSSNSPLAQLWFDRGLALTFAFNHEEAVRCFEKAIELDPSCAMAYWGAAYASGPNINNMVMDEHAVERAFKNSQLATKHMASIEPVEKDLIQALSHRYTNEVKEDRSQLNKAFAEAMREVYKKYPNDADIAALFAESMMVLRPWYHWTPAGEMMPETKEIVAVLEVGLSRWPQHPALCHYYIHTMEASPFPDKALKAANQLRQAMPGAGHLLHMPSHIDVLVGDYEASIKANQNALAADAAYLDMRGNMNFYTLYRIHNYHFIVYSAMFDGQSELALKAAKEIEKQIPDGLLAAIPDFLEAFIPTVMHVYIRFGHWQEILKQPQPDESLFVTRTVWHYARALAFAATGDIQAAQKEKTDFDLALSKIPETRYLFNNRSDAIMGIAESMINGEIAYRKGEFKQAFANLREAVDRDDALNYDEPWGWMQPARHALGALLLEQGQVDEAEQVYRADLKKHPNNAWSLHGLAECLARKNLDSEAKDVNKQLTKACSRADVDIKASCYCRLGGE